MSVNINFRPTTNETKWKSIKEGDFVVIEGNPTHPLPTGLYRIFVLETPGAPVISQFILIPLFDGPFQTGMFPYMLVEGPFPTIQQVVTKIHIEVEVN